MHAQDEVEDDVENTTGRIIVTTKRLRVLLRKSNECKLMLCLLITIAVLVAVLVLALRLSPALGLGR